MAVACAQGAFLSIPAHVLDHSLLNARSQFNHISSINPTTYIFCFLLSAIVKFEHVSFNVEKWVNDNSSEDAV